MNNPVVFYLEVGEKLDAEFISSNLAYENNTPAFVANDLPTQLENKLDSLVQEMAIDAALREEQSRKQTLKDDVTESED